ncbi:MAG: hypothetical protein KME60_29845 [Cyanomargarita calcarea GSE-NOS-MK-12-04C]|uniref:Uncharacterized protein n=1 Tax=Cyanomargarita calcarea GSE-NOS-MK-12-04C TaxID=2839659 RepID=A0A951QVZ7_9CYAN|nr:hypothetical protein [Cyanomargarita calcarea GSE-NOS-MK-12-04C]
MKFKSAFSTALLLSVIALSSSVNTTPAMAETTQKPYCTAASKQGGYWWTWTASSVESACFTAFTKVINLNQSVDSYTSGTYKTNGLNKGNLRCKQGNKNGIIGTGGAVFENGINTSKELGWNGCTFKIIN